MSRLDLFKILLVVFSAITCDGLENQLVLPFSDWCCKNPLNDFTHEGYESWAPSFTLGGSASGNGYTSHINLQLSGAEVPNTQTEYGTSLSTRPIDLCCHIISMKPTVENQYGQLDSNQAPGNILNIGTQGYYTSLLVDSTLMNLCCGIGDRTHFASGDLAFYTRHTPIEKESLITGRGVRSKEIDGSRGESFTSRASAFAVLSKCLIKRDTFASTNNDCFAKAWVSYQIFIGDLFPSAGLQVAVGPSQPFPVNSDGSPTCNIASSIEISSGVSLSTSLATTTTTTLKDTIYMGAGVSWPIDSIVADTVSFELAKTISNSGSKVISNSTTATVIENLEIAPGIMAFLSFTPSYICYEPDIDCIDTPNVSNLGEFANPAF